MFTFPDETQEDVTNIRTERDALINAQKIAALSQQPLPADWGAYLDPVHGIPYYVHHESGRTTWERPAGNGLLRNSPRSDGRRKLDPLSPLTPRTKAMQDAAAGVANFVAEKSLPPGWTEVFDKKRKRNYYVNENGEVSWIRPVATKEEAQEISENALKAMDTDGDGIITKAELDEWAKLQDIQASKPPRAA
jgi:hypothetical protein